jgi:hypothetical protein
MSINSSLRVYVLGAGCSYDEQQGYPLANGFLSELEIYAAEIRSRKNREQIEKSVQQTVELLKHYQSGQYQVSTIDQLINLILRGQCDDYLREIHSRTSNETNILDTALRSDAVRNAKISASACFLEKERQVMDRLLSKYQAFICKIFSEAGISTPCSVRLQNSNARVFSFNYDRLFELAFFGAGFVDNYLKSLDPYSSEVLNSGLNVGNSGNIQILKNRFCFIKLHGSIGFRCKRDLNSQTIYSDGDIANWKHLEITDEMFFGSCVPGQFRDSPLIVFPFEKDFVLSGKQNTLASRDYISKTWRHAKIIFQAATEIFVIGYSFSDPMDSKYLVELIREAKNCRQIEIQNLPGECDRISTLLSGDYAIQVPVKKNPNKF